MRGERSGGEVGERNNWGMNGSQRQAVNMTVRRSVIDGDDGLMAVSRL
jgi:hypothetical protein